MEKQTNNNRPKLELEVDKPVKVKLMKDKPFEGRSAYGAYKLYSLEVEGQEKAYFAPPEFDEQVIANAFKSGDEFILRKVAVQSGRKILSKVVVERVKTQPSNGSNGSLNLASDNLKDVMEQCLKDALAISKAIEGMPFQTHDLQKIASCLFIART